MASGYSSYTNNGMSNTNWGSQQTNDFLNRNASAKDAGSVVSSGFQNVLDNPVFSGIMGGIGSLLGGKTAVNQYGTKTGEQMGYANAALQQGQGALSQLGQIGAGPLNMYNQMGNWQQQYQNQYINPMMSQVNKNLMHSTNKYSSANTLQRQRAMMDIGAQLAQRVGQERQLEMQGGLAGQQSQLSALSQTLGASNNALNQSFFDTKVGKEGGLGGIVGGILGAVIGTK